MHAKRLERILALLRTLMHASALIVHTQVYTATRQEPYLLTIDAIANALMDPIKVSHTQTKLPLLHVLVHAKLFHGIHVTAPTRMHVWEPTASMQVHTFIEQYDLHLNSTA